MGAGITRAISPKDYFFSWGAIICKNFSKDDAIKISRNADDWVYYVGIGGEATILEQTDESGLITVYLPESAAENQLLDAQRKLHKSRAIGPQPVLVRGSGTTTFAGAKAVSLGGPKDRVLGNEVKVLEWNFFVSRLTRIDGFAPEV